MSTTTNQQHEIHWVELAAIPQRDTAPEIRDDGGEIRAPVPPWAIYAGSEGLTRDRITYVGPSVEIETHPDFGVSAVIEVRADLHVGAWPQWIEWTLMPTMIHIDDKGEGFSIEQARKLAAEILRLADEVEGVER